MNLIIAGSRTLEVDSYYIANLIKAFDLKPTTIISGGARGIDTCAKRFAVQSNYFFKEFPADWDTHGKAAGYIRNKQMASYGNALLLIWDGKSRGSQHMKDLALANNLKVYEQIIKDKPCR